MHFGIVETTLIALLTVLIVTFVFQSIRLPVVVGYLIVGTLIGPYMLGWMEDTQDIRELAEFGVAFLMFTIGLEFSLSKLQILRFPVFVLGGLQVVATILVSMLVGLWLHMPLSAALVIGCVTAMSSTSVVVKQLSEQFELQSEYGLNAVGILLFQDLAIIPILVLMASLSGHTDTPFGTTILWALAKGVIAILAIIALGRGLLKPLFHYIASTRIIELFTISVLFVAIGSAWLTHSLGLSYSLGAFFAGIMLGETEFRHQIKSEIRPFRDVLLGLFFVSIGMLVNVRTWGDTWQWILLVLVSLMIGKTLIIIMLSKLSNYGWVTSTRTGVVLAQGGEFGFAILSIAVANNLLPREYSQVVLGALLITLALAPIIIRNNERLAKFLFPERIKRHNQEMNEEISSVTDQLKEHVIICGYGRVGQNIAQFLNKFNYRFVSFDLDPKIIRNARLAGYDVFYGNATAPDVLEAANIEAASAVVISFYDMSCAHSIINHVRQVNPNIPILARCNDDAEFDELRQCGATQVVTSFFEVSLSLVSRLFQALDVADEQINQLLQQTREKNYAQLYQVFPGTFEQENFIPGMLHESLRPIRITDESIAHNQCLSEITLNNVQVISIRRDKKLLKPNPELRLHADDTLILFGSPENLDLAETILLTQKQ